MIAPVQHRPAPDDRLARRHEKAHAHDAQPVLFDRLQLVVGQMRPFVYAQQVRNTGTIHVGVHQADLRAGVFQAVGQAGGDRALADATLCPSRRRRRSWPRGRSGRSFPVGEHVRRYAHLRRSAAAILGAIILLPLCASHPTVGRPTLSAPATLRRAGRRSPHRGSGSSARRCDPFRGRAARRGRFQWFVDQKVRTLLSSKSNLPAKPQTRSGQTPGYVGWDCNQRTGCHSSCQGNSDIAQTSSGRSSGGVNRLVRWLACLRARSKMPRSFRGDAANSHAPASARASSASSWT